MLYPRINQFRQLIDLSGFWDFRADPVNAGGTAAWSEGFSGGVPLAVPASWNDQLTELRDFLGPAWYSTAFTVPAAWDGGRLLLRFDSVNYLASAWLNGTKLGDHEGGHLPFAFDVTKAVRPGRNLLVLRVDGTLAADRVPPGDVPPNPLDGFPTNPAYPNASFDFFPFCGIHRPVRLCLIPHGGVEDVQVVTSRSGRDAQLTVELRTGGGEGTRASMTLSGHGATLRAEVDISSGISQLVFTIPDAAIWSPEEPHLYDLEITLFRGSFPFDSYALPVGIRTIEVSEDRLLLNGKPILLKGFGRHEDFPVTGRGIVPAVIVRDFDIMRWTGANSFRTTHYPYSEEMMDLADRLGFLVIDETPSVGLFFTGEGLERRRDLCASYLRDLIQRDRNHPSVIAWSIANEPHSRRPAAGPFLQDLVRLAKSLDDSRPVTVVSHVGVDEEAFRSCDLLCLNRYYGWYTEGGRIDEGCRRLSQELDALHARFGKPIILTEFGTDTLPGWHAQPAEMFAEEYQAEFLERYIEVLRSKPWVVGQHVWNLCDFKTGQSIQRVGGMNLKGVFTRDRRPKMAAHVLRRLWGAPSGSP
jgi:beta-glucuronidase